MTAVLSGAPKERGKTMRFRYACLRLLRLLAIGASLALPLGRAAGADEAQPRTDSQPAARSELPPKLQQVLNALDEANKKVEDVRADIEYLREIPLLEESQKSNGTIAFKKPNLIHLKLQKPRNEEVCTDGKQWWVVSHNDKQVEIYSAEGSADAMAEASFLTIGYGESSENLLKKYVITLEDARGKQEGRPKTYRLKFVPRKGDAPAARFSAIELELPESLWLPSMMVLHESDGEIIHTFQFKNVKLNSGIKEKEFVYEPPKGYVIVPMQK
jgi:outer membrane lipoprotein-sorting protein